MEITAVAVEDLEGKGLDLLKNKLKLTTKGDAFPDTYGVLIGRYDKDTGEYQSFFNKDEENSNTYYFDEYRKKCNLAEKHRTVISRAEEYKEKNVIDYYVMYDIKESSKGRPTEIEEHVDNDICMNGHFVCEYELLFVCEGATRRLVVEYSSNNIPMYKFIADLEEDIEEALELEEECEETNPFKNVFSISDYDNYHEITMFDEFGMNHDIEFARATELMAMLVSVRLLSCTFVEAKEK